MNNKIMVPMFVGAGIGYLRGKSPQATVIGGLSGIGVGIAMNLLGFNPGLSGAGVSSLVLRRSQEDREARLPDFDFSTIPPYTGRIKYY